MEEALPICLVNKMQTSVETTLSLSVCLCTLVQDPVLGIAAFSRI